MYTPSRSTSPVVLSASTESQVYLLFAVAIGLTGVGAYLSLLTLSFMQLSGLSLLLLLVEVGLLLSAPLWIERYPLNYLLFAIFPLFSGFTLMPYLLWIIASYANGGVIVLNALAATACMTLAGAVAVRTLGVNLSGMGRALMFGVIGLIALGILQIFIPSLRSTQFELLLSGAGVVIFALFTAYDLQRIQAMGKVGANPIMLALSLYLDIYNLFLYLLRFMTVISGDRR